MAKKLVLQKMAQLLDVLPRGERNKVAKDYLELKLSKDDKFHLTMANKYLKNGQ